MKKNNEIKEALFLIDMNNGFCEKGNLADPTIKQIVPNIIQIIQDVLEREEGFYVVNDQHDEKSVELNRYAPHCNTTEETATIAELAKYETVANGIFYKNSTCALFAPGMMEMLLKMNNLERVIITGCCTDICIQNFAVALRNFFDQFNMNVEIIVPRNAVETFDIPNVHDRAKYNERAFNVMQDTGIKLIKTYKGGE